MSMMLGVSLNRWWWWWWWWWWWCIQNTSEFEREMSQSQIHGVSDDVRFKRVCSAEKPIDKIESSLVSSLDVILSKGADQCLVCAFVVAKYRRKFFIRVETHIFNWSTHGKVRKIDNRTGKKWKPVNLLVGVMIAKRESHGWFHRSSVLFRISIGLKSHVLISHDFLSLSKFVPLPRDRAAMCSRPASKHQKKFCFVSKQTCLYYIRSED